MRVTAAAGEYSAPNELTAPPGAALRAVNVVVPERDEYRTHVGMQAVPLWASRPITALTHYADTLVAHSESTGKLGYLSGGAWVEVPGTYNAPAGEPMDFASLQGALYFTTAAGVYRMTTLGETPVLSGLSQGLTGTGTTTGASGFLPEGFGVAYRWHWALNVDNGGEGRLVEGAPGGRLVVVNATGSGSTKNTSLSIPIPEGLPSGAYLRLFRSDDTPEGILPTDEVRQVYEREPTAAELTAQTMTVVDETPEAVRGPSAYYSANTGDGLGESNYTAPVCKRLFVFNKAVMGTCVTGVNRLKLNILGVGGGGIQDLDVLSIEFPSLNVSEVYSASTAGENFPAGQFKLFTGGTAAQNILQTVDSLVRAINYTPGGRLRAYSLDSDGSNPGALMIEGRLPDSPQFTINTSGNGQAFAPALQEQVGDVVSVERLGGVVTVTLFSPHNFVVDDDVLVTTPVATDPNFPAGVKVVTSVPTPESFTYAEAGANATGAVAFVFFSSDAAPTSTTGTALNAFAWAKEEEPDHWSLSNFGTVGANRETLHWGLPMDRFVFMGSEGGLYRLQGNARDGFAPVDNGVWSDTYKFLGNRNVARVQGRGYALTRTNIVSWTESTKPEPVDGPIQKEVQALLASHADNLGEYGYFVADETAKRLYVFVTTTPSGTKPDLAYMLNLNVSPPAWTRLTEDFPGLENGTQGPGIAPAALGGQLHLLPTNAAQGAVLKARNTATNSDFQGPAGEAIPASVQYLPWTAGVPEQAKMWTWTNIFTRAPLEQIKFAMSTDYMPEEYEQTLPDMGPLNLTTPVEVTDPIRGYTWPTLVGQNHMRGKAISFRVSAAVAGQPLQLLGLSVKHRPYGPGGP